MTLLIYEVFPGSENDPDTGPNAPPAKGMWVWWRTGPHPQGRWQAMQASSVEWGHAYEGNRKLFPVWQDQAHGESSDWGYYSCHACEYEGEGYPEPGHRTVCDGVCKRTDCTIHGPGGRATAADELAEAYQFARMTGLTHAQIIAQLNALEGE